MKRSEAVKMLGGLMLGGAAAPSHFLRDRSQQSGPTLVTDVRAYGAKGDAAADDQGPIQAAIDAVRVAGGGTVWFPPGHYRIAATVVVPAVQSESITLRGAGMRSSYLYPAAGGMTAIRFGDGVLDDSGNNEHTTRYCGMEDLSVNGSLRSSGGGVGVELVELQKGWMRNVIVEAFDKDGDIGLHLRGSRTQGVDAAAGPHTWRCAFSNIVVATTTRPLVIDNGDECDFYSCNFSLPVRLVRPDDSMAAVEIAQGHNNRFFGLLVSGERDEPYRRAYVGLRFRSPAAGNNLGHQVYGLVSEGFNHGVWIDPGVVGVAIRGFDSSISAHAYWNGSDDGAVNNQRQNGVTIETITGNPYARTRRSDWPETLTFPDGATQPRVLGSDTFACQNSRPTTIIDFKEARPGQIIFVRLDGNTRIAAGPRIRPVGNAEIVGLPHLVVGFAFIGGEWEQISVSQNS